MGALLSCNGVSSRLFSQVDIHWRRTSEMGLLAILEELMSITT